MAKWLSLLALLPTTAHAHWGHVGEAAGHDHWVIGAILGGVIVAGVLGALKGDKDSDDAAQDVQDEDLQEA